MEVKLSIGMGDFISPSLACVKPMQIDRAKPNRVLRLEGLQDDTGGPQRAVAKVTLNDCLACSGCVTSAETVLISQQSSAEFLRGLASPATRLALVTISPAAGAAIAVHLGIGLREAVARLGGFFKGLGCHRVVDCGLATDLNLVQTAAEFVGRFRAASLPPPMKEASAPLPVLSSTCPGWVCYAEKVHGAALTAHLSAVKSPQQIAGTLVKYGYAAGLHVPPEAVYHATVMPCFDKKLEASRDDFFNAAAGEHGARDVDCVLSSAEVLSLVDEKGLSLPAIAADAPDADTLPFSSLAGEAMCYASPGASGGVAEFVFRAAAAELFGVHLGPDDVRWEAGKNRDVAELTLHVGGEAALRFARAYGFRNIQNVVRRIKSGKCAYHFVEMMACPSGCANGGGQPRPPPLEAPGRAALVESRRISPEETRPRAPHENGAVSAMYAPGGMLEGGPLGARAQALLHTQFHARTQEQAAASNPMGIQW